MSTSIAQRPTSRIVTDRAVPGSRANRTDGLSFLRGGLLRTASQARDILARVYDDPCTPSDLAEATETTLQNIRYHLDNLLEAELVEVVDTWYSQTGNEMEVYAPTAAALVLFAGVETTTSNLRSTLGQVLGAVGILGILSGLVQWLAQMLKSASDNVAGGGTGTVGTSFLDTAPPGVLVFAGGLLLLAVFVVWWAYQASTL